MPAYAALCPIAGAFLIAAAVVRDAGAARASWSSLAGLLAALSLLCGGFALMDGAIDLAEMFLAATLIGAASQTRVEAQADGLAAVKTRW